MKVVEGASPLRAISLGRHIVMAKAPASLAQRAQVLDHRLPGPTLD